MTIAGGYESVTKEFITYGPIKLSTLNAKFDVQTNTSISAESNIFLVDSEGTGNVDGQVRDIFLGVMALLPIASVCVNVT